MGSANTIELFHIETVEEVTVIGLTSSSIIGADVLEAISRRLREMVDSPATTNLVIDFSNVSFFSSQMLGLLVDLWRRLKETGGKLVVCGINPQLNRVFRITHLDKLFTFYPDKQTAISVIHSGT